MICLHCPRSSDSGVAKRRLETSIVTKMITKTAKWPGNKVVKALPLLTYTHIKAEKRESLRTRLKIGLLAWVMGNEIVHRGYLNVNITGSKHRVNDIVSAVYTRHSDTSKRKNL